MDTRATFKTLKTGFDVALAKLPAALKAEGFGVLTEIDMQQTFRDKLGVEYGRYRIIGACNPTFAKAAVDTDPRVGVFLPCNVVLYERADGVAVLGAIDPVVQLGAVDPRFHPLAVHVKEKLGRVLAAID